MKFRFIYLAFYLIAFNLSVHSEGYDHLQQLENFKTLSTSACQQNKIMVVMVSREYCPYCIKLKKQVLIPELKNGALNSKWLLRELLIDDNQTHIGFDGNEINSMDFSQSIEATVTPTLLFLGPDGIEIGKRIIGTGGAIDFYGFYLKRSINEALNKQNCLN